MVFGVVASLAGLVKVRISKTHVDNNVFMLHYRMTSTFCFLACALLTASDFIGKPIQCIDSNKKFDNVATTFCWITSTFTINTTTKDATYYSSYGSKFHGIGNYIPEIHEQTFHAYYQWVPFILFLQGCLFYLPHQLWKTIEGKHAEKLLQGISNFSLDDLEQKKSNIISYLKISKGLNQKYCFGYVFCEILNMVNVLLQMFLLDTFFGGMFLEYGSKLLFLAVEDDASRYDPMIKTFPRVTKCTFHIVGASGTIENQDYLCILPQNILNEKIFLLMWIWMVALSTITGIQLIYRAMMLHFPMIRVKLLEQRGKIISSSDLELLVRTLHLGDFFLLYNIGRNVSTSCFSDIIKGLMTGGYMQNNLNVSPNDKGYSSATNLAFEGLDTIDRQLRNKIKAEEQDTSV